MPGALASSQGRGSIAMSVVVTLADAELIRVTKVQWPGHASAYRYFKELRARHDSREVECMNLTHDNKLRLAPTNSLAART